MKERKPCVMESRRGEIFCCVSFLLLGCFAFWEKMGTIIECILLHQNTAGKIQHDQSRKNPEWKRLGSKNGGSVIKNPFACQARNQDSISGSGKSPWEGNDKPLQYSCLENSTDRGAPQSIVHGVEKSWTQLSTSMEWMNEFILSLQ